MVFTLTALGSRVLFPVRVPGADCASKTLPSTPPTPTKPVVAGATSKMGFTITMRSRSLL